MKAILLIIFLSSFFNATVENNYRDIFGSDYTWAESWLKEHDSLIAEYALRFNIPAEELKAIVFPELIRYNGLMNVLETESLKYLYVSEGKHYADFSIGYFQMKPSFAEMVEEDGERIFNSARLTQAEKKIFLTREDNQSSRRERVRRLSNSRDQIIYLCAFYKICANRFGNQKFSSVVERLKFFATCYNAGYHRKYEDLLVLELKKTFYKYNYSSVSAYYYTENGGAGK